VGWKWVKKGKKPGISIATETLSLGGLPQKQGEDERRGKADALGENQALKQRVQRSWEKGVAWRKGKIK